MCSLINYVCCIGKPLNKENNSKDNNSSDKVFLRDHLAAHRTVLANERTLLAYVRTALTLIVAGITFIRFFGSFLIEILGWVLIPIGFLTLIKGVASFKKMKHMTMQDESIARTIPRTKDRR